MAMSPRGSSRHVCVLRLGELHRALPGPVPDTSIERIQRVNSVLDHIYGMQVTIFFNGQQGS